MRKKGAKRPLRKATFTELMRPQVEQWPRCWFVGIGWHGKAAPAAVDVDGIAVMGRERCDLMRQMQGNLIQCRASTVYVKKGEAYISIESL